MSGRVHDAQLPVEQRRLKRAFKLLVSAVGGTADAGDIAGMRQQRVSECTLPNCPAFPAIDAVVALEEEARGSDQWPAVTRAMARHHGFELMPLPATCEGSSDWHRSIGEVSREVGEAVSALCLALAGDGKVTANEIVDCDAVSEIDEAIGSLMRLKGLCLAELGKGAAK